MLAYQLLITDYYKANIVIEFCNIVCFYVLFLIFAIKISDIMVSIEKKVLYLFGVIIIYIHNSMC
ncbi:hypothetical protein JCM15093_684 [Bacteroides graminisolvens DSM 19988 = JCM 15093]|uniref:Uncharacterized protein n=1 Tax=Bacteroides graminisolvens DSM 19988 = JCM 15093 TaxID=1121097 RepID=A0A069CZY8_9BACE|nr:hypothetical protein JCM15093_684 [Bacteroides graminisolvens DSM 19988 = JCM 15093]